MSIIRLANYSVTTSLIYKTDSIGDTQGFSVETLTGVTPSWKMEYLEGCSTAIRCVVRKVGLYNLEFISPWGCNFWVGGIEYDSIPPLGLSL